MGREGIPTNEEYIEEDANDMQWERDRYEKIKHFKNHPEWSTMFKKQMSKYGSVDNRHYVQEEYKEALENGDLTFHDAQKRYAEDMAAALLGMKEKQNKLLNKREEIYGKKHE